MTCAVFSMHALPCPYFHNIVKLFRMSCPLSSHHSHYHIIPYFHLLQGAAWMAPPLLQLSQARCRLSIFWTCLFVFFFVRQGTNLILPHYLVICVGTHFQIVVVFTPGCMSVCVAAELDTAKSSVQFRLNGVTVKNQKDKEQDREEKNQEPSGSFIWDLNHDCSLKDTL